MRWRPRGRRRSVDRGTRGLGIEPRNVYGPGRRRCREKRKATRRAPPWRGARRPCAVRDPTHAGTPSAREPGDPWAAWHECARPRREGFGRDPLLHGPGKSDPPLAPGKRPNSPGRAGGGVVEGRGGAEGTAGRQSTVRTLSRDAVSQALARVREAAKRNRRERFTALMHHLTPDLLAWAFHQVRAKAAPGIEGVTWEEYAASLDANIGDLHRRVMRGGYRAKPSRRQYIPKPAGRQRPPGISALAGKIVQRARAGVVR